MTGELLGPDGQPIGRLIPGGVQQQIDGDQLAKIDDRWTREVDYAMKAREHLWVAILTHKISDAALEGMSTEPIHFDSESMLGRPQIGCLICERSYSSRERRRKCPGIPKGGIRP